MIRFAPRLQRPSLMALVATRARRAAVALPLSAALVFVLLPLSGCSRRPVEPTQSSRPTPAPAPRVPTGAERFASAQTSLSASLEAATRAFERGSTDATAIASVREVAASLPALDKGVKADFAKTRAILAKVGSKDKDAIQANVEKTYAKRRAELAARLQAVSSAETTAALRSSIAATSRYLDSITPDEPYQPLGTSLPHRIVDAKAGAPVLGARIAPAYAPHTPGATPSTLPVTPTADDTSQTVEIQFADEIRSLAASLGHDPVRMYEYVRNTIDFEPYYGSRKGATETLLEGSGNDIDTASLLIALYRVSDIPARYVSGVVEVPIERAMNWVGVETPEAAAKLFSAGGTPAKLLISGGHPKALQIEHTWAEVYVDYEDYRGAGAGTSGRRVWVALDGSFKSYEELPRIEVDTSVAARQNRAYASVLASAFAVDERGFVSIDYHAVAAATVTLTAETSAALAAVPEARNTSHPIGQRLATRVQTGVLPGALSLSAISVTHEWTAVPDSLVTVLHLSVQTESGEVVLSADRPLPQIGEGKIILGFSPASSVDQSIRSAYASIEDVPAYLVSTRAELLMDSEALSGIVAVPLGEEIIFNVTTSLCGIESRLCASPLTAGGMYAVGLDLGRVSAARMNESAAGFTGPLNQFAEGVTPSDVTAAGLVGGALHAAALAYFFQVDGIQNLLAHAQGVRRFRHTSALVTGTSMEAVACLGAPVSVRCPGLLFDVGSDASASVARADQSDSVLMAHHLASGAVASSVEGWLWHALFGSTSQGASAFAAIESCLRAGKPLVAVDKSNIAHALSGMDLPAGVAREVNDEVAAGLTVTLPTTHVSSRGWSGMGWVATDPATGDSGWMLSGGLSGGESSWDAAENGMWTLLSMVLLAGPMNDILSSVVWLASATSLGVSFARSLAALEKETYLKAELTAGFVAAQSAMCALFVVGVGKDVSKVVDPATGLYTDLSIGMALSVGSLAVSYSFWVLGICLQMAAGG